MKTTSLLLLATAAWFAHAAVSRAQTLPPINAPSATPQVSPVPSPAPSASITPWPTVVAQPTPAFPLVLPVPEPAIPPPPPHPKVRIKDKPEKGKLERATPAVEVWRPGLPTAQRVAGKDKHKPTAGKLGAAMITGFEPVSVILRFDRSLGGKVFEIRGSRGVVIDPAEPRLQLGATAEAMLQVALEPGQNRGEISFEVENVRTVLPLMRVRADMVAAVEDAEVAP